MHSPQIIELQGVRVHNLKGIDVNLPLHRLIAITGVSGSGKSSLAFDTLYAEGQRRYIESFSAYARQFLDRLEKPDADRIEHIPPAIAIRQNSINATARSTVATATEIHDYLRLLFSKIGRVVCPDCQQVIRQDTPTNVLESTRSIPAGTRFQICFPLTVAADEDCGDLASNLKEDGFHRAIISADEIGDPLHGESNTSPARRKTVDLNGIDDSDLTQAAWVLVDRLSAGKSAADRILDSLELAFRCGDDRCLLLTEVAEQVTAVELIELVVLDGRSWHVERFSSRLVCDDCQREFVTPEPRLFSFNGPLGACPECQGFGSVPAIAFDRLVPDPTKSLRDGAIAAWTTPAYVHELEELLDLADDYNIPVDVPFADLQPEHLELIVNGVPERDFGGLTGFFRWLERHRYKTSVRVFLNRWRAYESCSACGGGRLQPLALAVRIDGHNIADACRLTISDARRFVDNLLDHQSDGERKLTEVLFAELRSRLAYLSQVGLDYLTLNRPMRTLSGGEMQRVALTATLGSNLVNTLYVLDEPSAGLHPRDSERVIDAIRQLRMKRNTVVVVEHDEAFIRQAEHVVDIGPGAGQAGGTLVFQGSPEELDAAEASVTGAFLSGRRSIAIPNPSQRRRAVQGCLRLEGARQHTLKNLTVDFPLGVLCVVTGVSGSGKSTLVEDTLYPALCRALGQSCATTIRGDYDRLTGVESIDEVILVNDQPIGRTPRSNPVTFMKAFDEIRQTFASTPEANLRHFTPKHFSFNVKGGGRCPKCNGNGSVEIDMQFLANISMTCPECHGTRYQREILEAKYRGLNIAEVLAMTVGEAFTFFRGQPKTQKRLRFMKEVGLDYLPLGQPANTLSGGESQRLKLASFLASGSRSKTLFILNEPTTGLHAADIEKLLDCFQSLLAVGHSLIIIEHNLDVIKTADHIIDLGPDAGDDGGEIVASGPPELIAACKASITGDFLREIGIEPHVGDA